MRLHQTLEKVFLLEIVKHILGFLCQTFPSLEIGTLLLCTCVREPHFGKTCIYKEIKFSIVLEIFSVSCVSFKEMFSGHYGHSSKLPRVKHKESMKIQYSVSIILDKVFCHLKCTTQTNLSEKVPFIFTLKALYYVFGLSKCTKNAKKPLHLK